MPDAAGDRSFRLCVFHSFMAAAQMLLNLFRISYRMIMANLVEIAEIDLIMEFNCCVSFSTTAYRVSRVREK